MILSEPIENILSRKVPNKMKVIKVAKGLEKADIVIKNANYVNVFTNEMCKGDIAICGKLIAGIGSYEGKVEIDATGYTIVPGLIDSHIHLESSLVKPDEFAKAVLSHGTTTVVTDPHEITNVMGLDGIEYMLQATEKLPLDVIFMLPSCVPATPMDESGAILTQKDMEVYFDHKRIEGLAEMMNYPGVVNGDEQVISKIVASQAHHKKIDGHAPGLSGKDLNAYIAAGVYSDHECDSFENALEKLRLGQYIMIREGTAAKNLKALAPLLTSKYSGRCMFATDDKHPSDLLDLGHIDYIIKESIKLGADPMVAIRAASYDAARYFLQNHKGAIAPGLLADIVFVDNLNDFNVKKVIKRGNIVFDNGKVIDCKCSIDESLENKAKHTFNVKLTTKESFNAGKLPVIGIIPGELISENLGKANNIDVNNDILKIAVVERHHNTGHIGLGYIKGYGLKEGAVATSVAHDSHNIIVVGTNDEDISRAVNEVINDNGGIVVCNKGQIIDKLPLPIAGLISDKPLKEVNERLNKTKEQAYTLGVNRNIDPFMTLSFMSLPVIPKLKITTQGVFDVEKWEYVK